MWFLKTQECVCQLSTQKDLTTTAMSFIVLSKHYFINMKAVLFLFFLNKKKTTHSLKKKPSGLLYDPVSYLYTLILMQINIGIFTLCFVKHY